MSTESYEIDGVKVTPGAGGYYDIEHAGHNSGEPERVQGKEKADARAAEIAKGLQGSSENGSNGGHAPGTGGVDQGSSTMQGQTFPNNFDSLSAEDALANLDPDKPKEPSAEQKLSEENAGLKALLAQRDEQFKQLLAAGQQVVKTVEKIDEDEDGPAPFNPQAVPTRFTGEMDAETKRLLKKMGMGTVKIQLDDNADIPPTGLFLGHNGRGYMIQPGVPVEVPEFLVNVLNDAKTSAPIVSSQDQKIVGYRNRLRYSYQVVKD